jgi:hypothetical protein
MFLAAIGPRREAVERGWVRHGPAADWQWILDRAEAHKLAALVAARLLEHDTISSLPDAVAARVGAIRERANERADRARRTLERVAAAFTERGLPFLVVKGALLAEGPYGGAARRPFYDLDVIVPRSALVAADALLHELGYRLGGLQGILGTRGFTPGDRPAAESLVRRFRTALSCEWPYVPLQRSTWLPVDLHWHLVPRWRLRLVPDQLWQHTAPAVVFDTAVRTLDREATLVHLAVHAMEPWLHSFRLLHLCDVAWTVDQYTGRPQDLWAVADAWGAAHHLTLALGAVDRLLAVPNARTLAAHRPAGAVARTSLAVVAHPRAVVDPPIRRGDRWWKRAVAELGWGLAMRGLRAKAAHSLGRRAAAAWWRLRIR